MTPRHDRAAAASSEVIAVLSGKLRGEEWQANGRDGSPGVVLIVDAGPSGLTLANDLAVAAKQPLPVVREFFGDKLVAELDMPTAARDPYPIMLPIFQQRVVRVLEAALAARDHRVEWSTRLATSEMNDRGVTAHVDREGRPETIHAGWIMGAMAATASSAKR
jgi:hypothetical protein